ncbi:hypothetical protein [Paraburkholderia aspalathi]|nr:hypothetical protein [Paraburkholderia aspalathi]
METARRDGANLDIIDLVDDSPEKVTTAGGSVQAELGNAVVVVVIGLT